MGSGVLPQVQRLLRFIVGICENKNGHYSNACFAFWHNEYLVFAVGFLHWLLMQVDSSVLVRLALWAAEWRQP